MQWSTNWKRQGPDWRIEPGMRGMALGSCFAEHVGEWLALAKCPVSVNPGGILYNPVSLAGALDRWTGRNIPEPRIVHADDVYYSLDHHSVVSGRSPDALSRNIQMADTLAVSTLEKAELLILSLGTAWTYTWKKDGRIVANCHKQSSDSFVKALLSVDTVVSVLGEALDAWHQMNPSMRVVLTVSPVRHLRDGFVENQRSKATLILAVDELVRRSSYGWYFPAYELLMDELRDYRFYDRDLLHPNELAVEHIMQAFSDCCFSERSKILASRVAALRQGLDHRPLQPESKGYRDHLMRMKRELEQLGSDWGDLDWSAEWEQWRQRDDQANRVT